MTGSDNPQEARKAGHRRVSMNMNLRKLQEMLEDRGAWHDAVHGVTMVGHDLATDQQHSLWTSEAVCNVKNLFYV